MIGREQKPGGATLEVTDAPALGLFNVASQNQFEYEPAPAMPPRAEGQPSPVVLQAVWPPEKSIWPRVEGLHSHYWIGSDGLERMPIFVCHPELNAPLHYPSNQQKNSMNDQTGMNRRTFLTRAAACAALASTTPSIIPASALGAEGQPTPSNRVTVGCIGTGERGRDVMDHFLNQPECQVVALCDVKQDALAKAKAMVQKKYAGQSCATFADFRQLLARPDIDAVLIASTDNWHVLHALAAVRAGKDLYVEKPLGLSLAEDQLLRAEVLKRKRVFQFGTQQRSERTFRLACELARNGSIGKLKHINIWAPGSRSGGSTKQVPPPPGVDYDFWIGPARMRPHTEDLTTSGVWWYVADFALGFIAGWGIHPMDIALWGAGDLALDQVEVSGAGSLPKEGVCDTATDWDVDFRFANGLTMKFVSSPAENSPYRKEWQQRYRQIDPGHGTAFEGADGWVHVDRSRINLQPEGLIDFNEKDFKTKLTYSADHVKSFLAAVKTRQPTVSPIESAVLSDAFCHVPNTVLRLGRKLAYNPRTEKFENDLEANRRLALRPPRYPWRWA
jgi:predicted dehydrogenase